MAVPMPTMIASCIDLILHIKTNEYRSCLLLIRLPKVERHTNGSLPYSPPRSTVSAAYPVLRFEHRATGRTLMLSMDWSGPLGYK
jgi:hypothetical protein